VKHLYIILFFIGVSYAHDSADHKLDDASDSNKTKAEFGYITGEVYNPKKVTKETFGATKNRFGQWDLPIGHPMLSLMKEGYMIHPKKPNAMIPNPHTNAGRKLIASLKPKYAPSMGFKEKSKIIESSYDYEDSGIASDFLKNLDKK
jgi:hypothetical protein